MESSQSFTWRDVLYLLQSLPSESLDQPVQFADADNDYNTLTGIVIENRNYIEVPVLEI